MDVVSMGCNVARVHQRVESGNAKQAFAGHAEEGIGTVDGGAENRQRSKRLHLAEKKVGWSECIRKCGGLFEIDNGEMALPSREKESGGAGRRESVRGSAGRPPSTIKG